MHILHSSVQACDSILDVGFHLYDLSAHPRNVGLYPFDVAVRISDVLCQYLNADEQFDSLEQTKNTDIDRLLDS